MNIGSLSSSMPSGGSDGVSTLMLRKAMDMDKASVAQLLQALPQPAPMPDPGVTVGRSIDTYA